MKDPREAIGRGRRPVGSLVSGGAGAARTGREEPDPRVRVSDSDGRPHRSYITAPDADGNGGILYTGRAPVFNCPECKLRITDAKLHEPHCAEEAQQRRQIEEFTKRGEEIARQLRDAPIRWP